MRSATGSLVALFVGLAVAVGASSIARAEGRAIGEPSVLGQQAPQPTGTVQTQPKSPNCQ